MPSCGSLHPLIKTLKSEYGDRLKVVFYQFPLIVPHKNALTAAHAAIAAKQQGKFWEMHNMLYENQAAWSELPDLRPVVTNFAIQLGLDVNRFVKDLDSPDIAAMVEADMQRGANFRVTSTPTLFINGQPVPNEKISLDYFRNEINERLK
ncbi:MAG: thioredoxin domain-containing protein [Acidobacteria bacterium]|nr:thioredoxin domain-containing protein [Acidobacteriota bacterium]